MCADPSSLWYVGPQSIGSCKDLVETDLNGPEFVGTAEYMSPEATHNKQQAAAEA